LCALDVSLDVSRTDEFARVARTGDRGGALKNPGARSREGGGREGGRAGGGRYPIYLEPGRSNKKHTCHSALAVRDRAHTIIFVPVCVSELNQRSYFRVTTCPRKSDNSSATRCVRSYTYVPCKSPLALCTRACAETLTQIQSCKHTRALPAAGPIKPLDAQDLVRHNDLVVG